MIQVTERIATKLQRFLETRFSVSVPIVVARDHRVFDEPTILVTEWSGPNPDGGSDLQEDLSLKNFIRRDTGVAVEIQFGYAWHGASSQIDYWKARVSGIEESERAFFRQLFDIHEPFAGTYSWWNNRLDPTLEFNGIIVSLIGRL